MNRILDRNRDDDKLTALGTLTKSYVERELRDLGLGWNFDEDANHKYQYRK